MVRVRLLLITTAFIIGGCAFAPPNTPTKPVTPGTVATVPTTVEKPGVEPRPQPVKKPSPEPSPEPVVKTDPKSKAPTTGAKSSGLLGNTSGSIVSGVYLGKSGVGKYSGVTGVIGSVADSVHSGNNYKIGVTNTAVDPTESQVASNSSKSGADIDAIVAIGVKPNAVTRDVVGLAGSPPGKTASGLDRGSSMQAAAPKPAAPGSGSGNDLDSYSVIVAADSEIAIPGPPGEMTVWIGSQTAEPQFAPDKRVGQKDIPALSDTAKVTPYTPGIEVEPKESICEKVVPSGSEVRFQLLPSTTGTFKIGADVALYPSEDCTGTPIPKTTASVKVKVVVNTLKKIEQGRDEIVAETWQGILGFWKEFIGLIAAVLLFLVRKKLYKWFGYNPDKEA